MIFFNWTARYLTPLLFLAAAMTAAAATSRLENEIRQISDRVELDLKKTFTREQFAREQNLTYPIARPAKSPKEIFQNCRRQAVGQFNEKHPSPDLKQLEARAALRYPLYKKGDHVCLETSHPSHPKVEGILNAVSEDKIIVGTRWVRMNDISKHLQLALDPVRTDHLRKLYIQELMQEHQARRRQLLIREIRKIFVKEMESAGYFPNESKEENQKNIFNSAYWTCRADSFKEKYESKFEALKKKRTEEALQAELPKKGFCKDKRSGQWRAMTFVEKMKSKL